MVVAEVVGLGCGGFGTVSCVFIIMVGATCFLVLRMEPLPVSYKYTSYSSPLKNVVLNTAGFYYIL